MLLYPDFPYGDVRTQTVIIPTKPGQDIYSLGSTKIGNGCEDIIGVYVRPFDANQLRITEDGHQLVEEAVHKATYLVLKENASNRLHQIPLEGVEMHDHGSLRFHYLGKGFNIDHTTSQVQIKKTGLAKDGQAFELIFVYLIK